MTTLTEPFEIVHADTSTLPRSEWLALRRQGSGSSDAAAQMGLSPWKSTYATWCTKRGLLPETAETTRQRFGRLLEPVILDEWRRRQFVKTGTMPTVRRHLMIRSAEFPWMLANPDGLTTDAVLEAKCADKFDKPRWDEGAPDHYAIQGQHLMIVAKRRTTIIPVLFGGNEYEEYTIEWTDSLAEKVIEGTRAFWQRVENNDPPDPDGSEATMLALRARFTEYTPGVHVELDETRFGQLLTLREAFAEQASEATKQVNDIKALVMEEMGAANAEVATILGEKVATWRATASGSRRFTWAR